jgi:GT2 family glycosyltransferase
MSGKRVIIIILNWNSSADTIRLLGTLRDQTYRSFEIIVVDNHSSDNSVEQLAPHAGAVTLIRNEKNLGYAGGNNVGIREAIRRQADYIWILNPDIRPAPETLSSLVNTMDHDTSIAAVGPRICSRDDPDTVYSDGGLVFPEQGYLVVHKNSGKTIHELNEPRVSLVDYANGSAILLRTRALEEIGAFREDFFLYYEETEWCLRAKRHGWTIATDHGATAYHQPSRKGLRYHFFMARNRILLAKVHGQYLMQSCRLELSLLLRYFRRPFHPNLLHLCARGAGIASGLLTPRREASPEAGPSCGIME